MARFILAWAFYFSMGIGKPGRPKHFWRRYRGRRKREEGRGQKKAAFFEAFLNLTEKGTK
jgi:hypothetical protein